MRRGNGLASIAGIGATGPISTECGEEVGTVRSRLPVQSKFSIPRRNNLRILLLFDFHHIYLLFALREGITRTRLLL